MDTTIVKLPLGFVGLKRYPGYYWHKEREQLYSLKSGELKPLKLQKGTFFIYSIGESIGPHYSISVKGFRKILTKNRLLNLRESELTYNVYEVL